MLKYNVLVYWYYSPHVLHALHTMTIIVISLDRQFDMKFIAFVTLNIGLIKA